MLCCAYNDNSQKLCLVCFVFCFNNFSFPKINSDRNLIFKLVQDALVMKIPDKYYYCNETKRPEHWKWQFSNFKNVTVFQTKFG